MENVFDNNLTLNSNMNDKCNHIEKEELISLLKEHKKDIVQEIDVYSQKVEENAKAMSTSIINGFDRMSDKIVNELKEFRTALLPSATNEHKVETKVIMPIIYTLCGVITALIIWFTGVKPFIPIIQTPSQYEQRSTN